MDEIKHKILQKRTFQKKVVGFVLSVLGRGLRVCRNDDPMVRAEINSFPPNFIFVIGIYGSRHPLILQKRKGGLHRIYESFAQVCQKLPAPSALKQHFSTNHNDPARMLEIRFKSVEAGWRMVTGQESVAQAYARHDLIIIGEVSKAMQLFRCIERVRAYLLPEHIAHRRLLLPQELPQKRWKIWLHMLYVKKRRKNTKHTKKHLKKRLRKNGKKNLKKRKEVL